MTMTSVNLYQYQIDLSNKLADELLDINVEVKVDKSLSVIKKSNYFFLQAPLGSGKTRLVSRVASLLIDSDNFNTKTFSFDLPGLSHSFTEKLETKIIILTPVSVITQWEEELKRWNIDFYTIKTPKSVKNAADITKKVILVSDIRTADLTAENLKDTVIVIERENRIIDEGPNKGKKVTSDNYGYYKPDGTYALYKYKTEKVTVNDNYGYFCPDSLQFYIFVDECDTIKINKNFGPVIRNNIKSLLFFTANDMPVNNAFDLTELNEIRYTLTKQDVEKIITIPPLIEKTYKIDNNNIITNNYIELPLAIRTQLQNGDIINVFKTYNLPDTANAVDFLQAVIIEKNDAIQNHIKLTGRKDDTFVYSTKNSILKIEDSIKYWSKSCHLCKKSIKGDYTNCIKCFYFYCTDCEKSSICEFCKPNSITTIFRTREQAFHSIVANISSRDKTPKKTLLYCSSPSLIQQLNSQLEIHNCWAIEFDGSTDVRKGKIAKFKEADTNIYLICNSVTNSAGIHLPECTDIIIYHEMAHKYDTQIIGRGQRLGRTSSLHVHRII